MILEDKGKITDRFYVVGHPGVPMYLLDGAEPVLFDAGITALALCYEEDLKAILGRRKPAYLFLTHSHFDHIGAASHLKRLYPEMRIAGSARVNEILHHPRAIQVITQLNREAVKYREAGSGLPLYEADFEPFSLDVVLEPDEAVELSDACRVQAIGSPGHTWDFLSYYVPEKEILVASEAVGCDDGSGYIYTEFLVDYDVYLRSLETLSRLDVRVLCPGHKLVATEKDARDYLRRSLEQAADYLEMVEGFLRAEGGRIQRTVARVKAAEWDPKPFPKQIESAYLLNTTARVKKIRERMQAQV